MKLNQKNWSDKNKVQSRIANIVNPYRKYFHQSLPKDRQFWTLSGQCTTNLEPLSGCELLQMIEEGLITPDQYRGVEFEKEICENNQAVYPCVPFTHGDFYEAMKKAYMKREFNPGIINFDSTYMPMRGIQYLSDILCLVNDINIEEVLIIGNFAQINPHGGRNIYSPEDMISLLKKNEIFCHAFKTGGWKYHLKSNVYRCRSSRTPFMSILFYR